MSCTIPGGIMWSVSRRRIEAISFIICCNLRALKTGQYCTPSSVSRYHVAIRDII